jgi:penicillin-binding protein 2
MTSLTSFIQASFYFVGTVLRQHRTVWLAVLFTILLTFNGSSRPALAQEDEVRGVVSSFLDAWEQKDTPAMYALLSSISQSAFPEQVFSDRYAVANSAIDFTALDYEIHDVTVQGESAMIEYDLSFESNTFDTIEDADRVMRLIRMDGRWGVAWSSMDILKLLAGNSSLQSSGDLEPRASIYDRNGNPVAYTGTMVAIYSNRNNMPGEPDCQNYLADLTNRPVSEIATLFVGNDFPTDFLLAEIDLDTYTRESANFANSCGTSYTREYTTRVYYGGNAMLHVVGYIGRIQQDELNDYLSRGYQQDSLVGQYGIEEQYERELAGTPQRVLRIVDPGGITLATLGGTEGSSPSPVTLTIDRDLQVATSEALYDAYQYAYLHWSNGAGPAGAVVLDVNSGAILAMSSYPTINQMMFNTDTYMDNETVGELIKLATSDGRQPLRNHAVEDQYAPGSVYKVITAAAVLDQNVVEPTTIFDCGLTWNGAQYGDTAGTRSDWRATDGLEAAGPIVPAQAIMASCNPFFWEQGVTLWGRNREALVDYSREMGLGSSYNIFGGGGALHEASGILRVPGDAPTAINNAIGQGDVQLPPIQMGVAAATIANDGTVYKPYLTQRIGGVDGTEVVQEFEPTILNELEFAPDVLSTIREGMCGVTTDVKYGTAEWVFNADYMEATRNYTVCGKTGTAEAGDRPNAWFIAFAPAENPQIAIVVAVHRAGREGSEVAAPIARRILDYYFNAEQAVFPPLWLEPFEPLDIPVGGGVG